jgi:hypothetical protein
MIEDDKPKNRKPAPLIEATKRASCPVCGKPTYSASGIHPQCACHQHPNFSKKKG